MKNSIKITNELSFTISNVFISTFCLHNLSFDEKDMLALNKELVEMLDKYSLENIGWKKRVFYEIETFVFDDAFFKPSLNLHTLIENIENGDIIKI